MEGRLRMEGRGRGGEGGAEVTNFEVHVEIGVVGA